MISVKQIENYPINSNCFIISFQGSKKVLVVDPGTPDCKALIEYLDKNKFTIEYVILTHEHFDHCAGVNHLAEKYYFEIICSEIAEKKIANSRGNFSFYYEYIEPFEINGSIKKVTNKKTMNVLGNTCTFIETPGHSPGSICFYIDKHAFTGDTLLIDYKTPLKLPGGNKVDFEQSLKKIHSYFKKDFMIYPGHGDAFLYEEYVKKPA